MVAKLNIANILKDKPSGTKLYADAFGELSLERVKVNEEDIIHTRNKISTLYLFYNDGKFSKDGEPILVPSKEMRDWSKFAWKKGDALSCGVDNLCIFEKWANEEYTEFYAKFVTPNYSGNTFKTEKWSKETNEEVIKQYISNIEEFKGGKLNITTLEIEKTQPEFKDGDILHSDETEYSDETIFIAKISGGVIGTYAYIVLLDKSVMMQNDPFKKSEINAIRLATDSEKQQLFDALAKEGKVWDAERKAIVDLKPKVELKPFDKVLSRRCSEDYWVLNLYSHKTDYYHICIDGSSNLYCIPYNEETAHLLGTTDEWKGSE